ncbi:unnamed protein product [Rhizopus stolonifer]
MIFSENLFENFYFQTQNTTMAKKTKAAKAAAAAAAAPQKQEKKPKMVDTSEIDDIFNTKKIASVTEEEPVSKKRKADKKETSDKPKKVAKKNESEENEESEESEEGEEEEFVEQDFKKVQEVVFAELAAVKNANKGNKKQHVIPPSDDSFGDSRGIKKTNRTTEEGYPLYDVKDLNIGLGKDTPECPFDCQCCF